MIRKRKTSFRQCIDVWRLGIFNSIAAQLRPQIVDREDDLDPSALDALSLLFMLRRVELREGEVFVQTIHEKGENRQARVEVVRRELVSTPLGPVRTIRVRARVPLGKKLETRRDTEVWISDDERRVIVRFDADLKFGSLKGVLASYRREGAP